MAFSEPYFPVLEAARLGDPVALERLLQRCQPDSRHNLAHALDGQTIAATKSRLHRARQRMREVLPA